MKNTELLKKLEGINKPFYTIGDLEKIIGLDRNSLYVMLNRWLKAGILERPVRGIYVPFDKKIPVEKIASGLYIPNYLSFESALSRYDILNLVPYTLTFATIRKSKTYIISETEVIFRRIKKDLFFGYEEKGEIYIAFPEKAFLDQVYLFTKGIVSLNLNEMDLNKLSKSRLKEFMLNFPEGVQKFVKEKIKI